MEAFWSSGPLLNLLENFSIGHTVFIFLTSCLIQGHDDTMKSGITFFDFVLIKNKTGRGNYMANARDKIKWS